MTQYSDLELYDLIDYLYRAPISVIPFLHRKKYPNRSAISVKQKIYTIYKDHEKKIKPEFFDYFDNNLINSMFYHDIRSTTPLRRVYVSNRVFYVSRDDLFKWLNKTTFIYDMKPEWFKKMYGENKPKMFLSGDIEKHLFVTNVGVQYWIKAKILTHYRKGRFHIFTINDLNNLCKKLPEYKPLVDTLIESTSNQ